MAYGWTKTTERLARYCARCPVSLGRLEYDVENGTVSYTSDKTEGPTAGRHSYDAVEFIGRLVSHIPDKGHMMQRYYGYYANRTRGERRKAQSLAAEARVDRGRQPATRSSPGRVSVVEPEDFSRGDAKRHRAELIRQVYEVDPLVCPKCGGDMRVIALIQAPRVLDTILRHLREKGRDGRSGPWATGPPGERAGAEAA